MKSIYLDHAATTAVRAEVLDAMLPFFSRDFGNASSVHAFGRSARKALEDARETVAGLIGADSREIYFTSGGTESDNAAIKGVGFASADKGKHIITSAIEHHAVLNPCHFMEKEGFEVTYLPVDGHGIVDLDSLEKAIRPDTVLVSIMLANNETGTLEPIREISRITRGKGIPLHTDAIQAIGKMPVNVGELGVDLLSISGHKVYGPKGVGVLYVRKGTKIVPLLHGGHHERQRRAGTENVPAIVGLAKAMELAEGEMDSVSPRLVRLRDRLEAGLREKIRSVYLNGHPEKRLPNMLNMSFKAIEGESLLLNLDMQGVAVSTGSACTSGSLEPSHVLAAMGVDPALAQGSLRFSLGRENTEDEIDFVANALVEIVERLRKMSPLYEEEKGR